MDIILNKLLVSAALFSITSLYAVASEETETTVIYDAKRGFAETLSISETEQLGVFRIVLKPISGSESKPDKLVLAGVMRGVLNPDFTLSHTFVNKDRTGALYTAGDTISDVYAGNPFCDGGSGSGTGTEPFEIEETLNIVAGTGIYAGVQPGSYIVVKGVVNNCPYLPEYGQNNFEVVGGTVTITE